MVFTVGYPHDQAMAASFAGLVANYTQIAEAYFAMPGRLRRSPVGVRAARHVDSAEERSGVRRRMRHDEAVVQDAPRSKKDIRRVLSRRGLRHTGCPRRKVSADRRRQACPVRASGRDVREIPYVPCVRVRHVRILFGPGRHARPRKIKPEKSG